MDEQPPSSAYAHAHALSSYHNQWPNQQQLHQHQRKLQPQRQKQVEIFWAKQMEEIEESVDFRSHSLPLARIKKIMKADEDVRMISTEAPVFFAKACEIFINELTLRAWNHTEETKRRTLQKNDIAVAIARNDVFDFLIDIVPRDELKEDQPINLGTPAISAALSVGSTHTNAHAAANSLPYYHFPNHHSVPHGLTVGNAMGSAAYTQLPRSAVSHMPKSWHWGHAQTNRSKSANSPT